MIPSAVLACCFEIVSIKHRSSVPIFSWTSAPDIVVQWSAVCLRGPGFDFLPENLFEIWVLWFLLGHVRTYGNTLGFYGFNSNSLEFFVIMVVWPVQLRKRRE